MCFLCDRCSRFAPSKSIFITNQRAAFCLLSLRGVGDIWLLPSAPASNPCAPQRLQICICECFGQCSIYFLLRPQVAWSTCLAWWLLGFLWANFMLNFLTTLCLVFMVAHMWLWSRRSLEGDVSSCMLTGHALDAALPFHPCQQPSVGVG